MPEDVVAIGHAPPPRFDGEGPTIAEAERRLSDWFDAPVVLTSSGRAALKVTLAELGLSRYSARLAVSAKTAACVFDAVVRHAFPVDPADDPSGVAATLLIQQYGFVQKWRPEGDVIEDICHAFYASPTTGARDWAGDLAVFSLPKFFSMAGMAGGVVARTPALADRVRQRIEYDMRTEVDSAIDRAIFQDGAAQNGDVEAMYLRRLLNAAPDEGSLAGLPNSIEFVEAGATRLDHVKRIAAAASREAISEEWRSDLVTRLPFAMPLFGKQDALMSIDRDLAQAGISAGIYQIDRARDNRRPQWTSALLIPCHQYLGEAAVKSIESAVRQ